MGCWNQFSGLCGVAAGLFESSLSWVMALFVYTCSSKIVSTAQSVSWVFFRYKPIKRQINFAELCLCPLITSKEDLKVVYVVLLSKLVLAALSVSVSSTNRGCFIQLHSAVRFCLLKTITLAWWVELKMPEMSGPPQVDINLGAESCFVFEVTKHKTARQASQLSHFHLLKMRCFC